jgi:hypothetical protein
MWRLFRGNVTLHFLIRCNRSKRLSGHGEWYKQVGKSDKSCYSSELRSEAKH